MLSLKKWSYFRFLLFLSELSVRNFQNSLLTFNKVDLPSKEGEIHAFSLQ